MEAARAQRGPNDHGPQRGGVVALGIFLACCPGALALNPSLEINQYAHKAWSVRDGFVKGSIHAIAQTPDGYLWVGTELGLYRFDGVRAVAWEPRAGESLPRGVVRSLLAARDGRLWIGTDEGLASWKDGKLSNYPELAGMVIVSIVEDREGTVWAGGASGYTGKICAIQNGGAHCYGEDGSLGRVNFLHEDSRGELWVGTMTGLWRWKPGPPRLYSMPDAHFDLVENNNGALLVVTRSGIKQLVNDEVKPYPLPDSGRHVEPRVLLRDRNGGLWIGTFGQGLVHVHQERADLFSQSDGLSGDLIYALFEDREANIWVVTDNGLDRFREFAVPTISVKQGLSNSNVQSVLAARDGSVWLGTQNGLNRWDNGQITIYRSGSAKTVSADGKRERGGGLAPVSEITDRGLRDDNVESIFEDEPGKIWVSAIGGGLAYLENGRFIPISTMPPGTGVPSIAGDHAGNVWVSENQGLFHLMGGNLIEQIPWAKMGRENHALSLLTDSSGGGLWLGLSRGGGLAYLKDGQVRASYNVADGMGEGHIRHLRLDHDGALWAATQRGLSHIKAGHVATLSGRNGLPCDTVHWSMEDDDHSVWLYTPCGLLRIARSELDAWGADSARTIQVAVFDSSDGVRSDATTSGFSPSVAKTADGKLWFLPGDGVSVVDPRHLSSNTIAPPVEIEQIIADRTTHWNSISDASDVSGHLRLPPLSRDLEIDYTALSLVAPEKNRFRVKLEGRDRDWIDVGNERKKFYTDLPPRNYRFRVMASNNNGVWNESGASFEFSVAPAYFQTAWFQMSCVVAFLGLLWALHRLRLHQIAQRFNTRMEARVDERTRIARELHDTLLQSFQALMIHFQAVDNLLPPGKGKEALEKVLDRADRALVEGRNAIQNIRSSTTVTNELSHAMTALGEELAGSHSGENGLATFRVSVEGTPRDLRPILRDDIYRIAREALQNAFRHAQASQIEAEITYGDSLLRLRVRDDGKGIDPKHLQAGRDGHWGLPGMRERAQQIGAEFEMWSEVGAGTEVELRIPGAIVYEKARGRGGLRLFRKKKEGSNER